MKKFISFFLSFLSFTFSLCSVSLVKAAEADKEVPLEILPEEVISEPETSTDMEQTQEVVPEDEAKKEEKEKEKKDGEEEEAEEEEQTDTAISPEAASLALGEGFGEAAKPVSPEDFLRGLQGNYETDLFTGSATFTYPLWIPAGRNRMQPDLFLRYSSSYGKFGSDVGYGWTLPVNAIYRSTPKGVDKLYGRDDYSAEIFGNYNELIVTDATNGEYAAKIEGNFSEYTLGSNTWTMTDTRGTVYTFGDTTSTRQVDPNDSSRVYKWMLSKVEDTNGNYMTFTYTTDNGQVYPDTIRYTGYSTNQGLYEVKFIRTANANPTTSYRTGFKVQTDYVISKVEVSSYHTGSSSLVRTYEFDYDTDTYTVNLLTSVTTKGGILSLPPIEFSYFPSGPSYGLLEEITHPTGGSQSLTYKPSTAYRTPAQGLANINLPFLIRTVNTSTLNDGMRGGDHTTTYEYAGGHYYFDSLDAYTREYAGFYEVMITDPADNVRTLYFHQSEFAADNSTSSSMGEFEDHISKKGRIFREEMYDDADHLYQMTIRKWDKSTLSDDNDEWDRYFPRLVRETMATYDGDADYKATTKEYSYDSYGNIIQQVDYGEVTLSGNDGGYTDTGTDKLISTIEYAENTTDYIVSLPKREELKNQSNTVIGETKNYYDGSATLGSVTTGNLTKQESLVETPSTYITAQLTYNTYGLPTEFTNARNYDTAITYDTHNLYPATVTNTRNQNTDYAYDYRFGVADEVTDPNGAKTITTFDSLGRMTQQEVTDPDSVTQEIVASTYSYNTSSVPNSVTATTVFDPDASPANEGELEGVTYFDGFGRVIQVRTEAEGSSQYIRNSIIYDERGNVKKELLPVFASGSAFQTISANDAGTTFTYDPMNRVTAITNPVGTTSTVYDQWENQITDANNNQKDLIFDARGNLTAVKEYLNSTAYTTSYTYDGNNNLTKITDAEGNVRNMTYDLLGRRLTMEDLHTSEDTTFGEWEYEYDANGNLTSRTDPKSQTTEYTYDELDRVSSEDYTGETGTEVTYMYDSGTYGIGRLSSADTAAVEKDFTYDILGRMTQESKLINSTTYTTSFTYDLSGNVLTVTYPDSMEVEYGYNNAGLLETVQKDSSDIITDLDYAPNGLVSEINYANGVSTVNTYDIDEIYRLTDRETTKDTTKLQDISYTYDPVGNITAITDASDTDAAKTAAYTYDDLDRLLSATITNTANSQDYTHTYTYDILGNILTRSDSGSYTYDGGNPSTSSGTNANPHAVTDISSTTYAYDDNGNLTSNGTWTHEWDYRDRLASSTDGTDTVEYTYDEAGQRMTKENTTSSKLTTYVNKYHDIEDSAGKNFIYAGNMKVATEEDSSIIYHHEDHLTGANVDTDGNGSVLELLDYFPYGNVRIDDKAGSYENDYKFTGKELDEDTNLYYYEARYYDAEIGRFVSLDPWEGDITDPQTLNKYTYTLNNPLKYVDVTGEKVELVMRKLANKIAGFFGSHSYLRVTPDNPEDFGLKESFTFTLGGQRDGESGLLVGEYNNSADLSSDEIRMETEITTPDGMTDTEFINEIVRSDSIYNSQPVEYALLSYEGGNCHNYAATILDWAGAVFPEGFDANTFDPGLNQPLEMTPGILPYNYDARFQQEVIAPERENQNENDRSDDDKNSDSN